MHRHHEPPDTSKGYDLTDLKISDIVKGTVGFFAFTIFSYVFVWGVMHFGFGNAGEPKIVGERPIPQAPNPVLQNQTTAKVDMYNMRHEESQALHTYGKSKADPGAARIPIDRAIDIVSQEGVLK